MGRPRKEQILVEDPRTPEEWQAAVDAARGFLVIESMRQYGLVTGGPFVSVDRCIELLDRGCRLGYIPSADAPERLVLGLLTTRPEDA